MNVEIIKTILTLDDDISFNYTGMIKQKVQEQHS